MQTLSVILGDILRPKNSFNSRKYLFETSHIGTIYDISRVPARVPTLTILIHTNFGHPRLDSQIYPILYRLFKHAQTCGGPTQKLPVRVQLQPQQPLQNRLKVHLFGQLLLILLPVSSSFSSKCQTESNRDMRHIITQRDINLRYSIL